MIDDWNATGMIKPRMDLYDQLPPEVRRALGEALVPFSAEYCWKQLTFTHGVAGRTLNPNVYGFAIPHPFWRLVTLDEKPPSITPRFCQYYLSLFAAS